MNDYVLDLYLRDVATALAPPPSVEQSTPRWESSPCADRDGLVMNNLRSVVRIALDYQGLGLPLGDLVNEGNLGLMRAAELYDPLRRVRFSHYAQPWIRVQMKRAVSYQAFPVSFPADFNWRHNQVNRVEQSLMTTLKRSPKDSEVAKECGLKATAVRRLRKTPHHSFVPFESSAAAGEEEGLTLAEVIPDHTLAGPDEQAAQRSDRAYLNELLTKLTPAEQKVIRLRFGLDDGCARTLQEVGHELGYVRQGVHRLETAAMSKLRRQARFQELKDQMLDKAA